MITIDTTTFQYLDISSLVESINADSERYVILIDGIDTIFASRDDENITDSQKEKTAKLLSLLDSPQSPTNVVFVTTTNYIDRLDSALTRKGRFDLVKEFRNLDKQSALKMCASFDLDQKESLRIVESFYDLNQINPVELQDKILNNIKNKLQSK